MRNFLYALGICSLILSNVNSVQAASSSGDVDQNGSVNTTDAMLILMKSVGLSMAGTNWNNAAGTGDVDCDGDVDTADAMLTLRFSVGLSMMGTAWCSTETITLDTLKAFPTAEGAGADSEGGRGGEVVYVTNHNASGEGSLKWALALEYPRTIVFAVGGRFNINSNMKVTGNQGHVTLAGQTANDIGGVHLAQSDFKISNPERALTFEGQDNLIFRYFDSRYNWQYLFSWPTPPGETANFSEQKLPTLRFTSNRDLIIDHVSSGWSSYGLVVTNANHSNIETSRITIQRSLMEENAINPDFQNHNVGMLLGTKSSRGDTKEQWNKVGSFSVHKNAFICESHRFPNTAGGDNAEFRVINNYIYGFIGDGTGNRISRIGGNSKNDFIANVYQEANYGSKFIIDGTGRHNPTSNNLLGFSFGGFLPMIEADGHMETPKYGIVERPNFHIDKNLFLDAQGQTLGMTQRIQADPLLMTFRYQSYSHDWLGNPRKEFRLDGTHLELGARDNTILRSEPASATAHPVSVIPASQVKADLLSNIGGNVRFRADGTTYIDDPIDQRYINYALTNSSPTNVGSPDHFVYPEYTNGSRNLATFDTDLDGMPNEWEEVHQLNPNVKDNNEVRANRDWTFESYNVKNNAGYTNLEMYLADIGGDFHMLSQINEAA